MALLKVSSLLVRGRLTGVCTGACKYFFTVRVSICNWRAMRALGLQVVNAVDLLDCQHEGFSLLSGRTGGCARGLLLFASLLTGSDPVIPGRNRVRAVMYDSWSRGRRQL